MSEAQEEVKRRRKGASKHDEHSDLEPLSEDRHRVTRAVSDPTQNQNQNQTFDQDQDPDLDSVRRKPLLIRSKTFDHCLLRDAPPDCEAKIERKKSHYSQLSKTNGHFHKIFKEISKEEHLQQSYTCALQKDILYQGRMFVSEHWICFHSKVFGKDTKIAIPVVSVTNVKKTKTALLLPNAVVISTNNDRYVFVSFLSRDNTYKFLMSVCLHLEEKSPCSSPVPSSANSSFRAPASPHFPLAFSQDFVKPRPDLEESSSSDSQTPDYDKMNDFPVPDFLLNRSENPPSPKLSEHQQKNHKNQTPAAKQANSTDSAPKHRGAEVSDCRAQRTVSLSTLLCVYLLLVSVLLVASCYLAFKILSLEQKLSSLGPVLDFGDQQDSLRAKTDSDLFTELISINLLKLEKVQRNLQRLLEEA